MSEFWYENGGQTGNLYPNSNTNKKKSTKFETLVVSYIYCDINL